MDQKDIDRNERLRKNMLNTQLAKQDAKQPAPGPDFETAIALQTGAVVLREGNGYDGMQIFSTGIGALWMTPADMDKLYDLLNARRVRKEVAKLKAAKRDPNGREE